MKLALNINIEKIREDSLKDYYVISDFSITFAIKHGSSEAKVKAVAMHMLRAAIKRGNESF